MQHADIAIAGAGIIGLATALELASAGRRVVVFDRGLAMRECSWAAAGMLATGDPETPAALRELSALSLHLYPEFLANIERLSGRKIPIRSAQALQATHTLPPAIEVLDPGRIHALVPGLQPNILKFFLLEEQSLDPRDLVVALPEAVKAAGVTLLEENKVTALRSQSNSVLIEATHGLWSASHFVNACGAWASDLTASPIFPRKGQILLVKSPEPLNAVIRTPDLYIVPRGAGRLIIGATVENAGYDKQVDLATISRLYEAAVDLWPSLRNAQILDAWTGLRPAAPDFLPIIGPSPAIDVETGASDSGDQRSWLALAHFRNGIMLAPGTARLLRQMILGQTLSIDVGIFGAGRFAESLAR